MASLPITWKNVHVPWAVAGTKGDITLERSVVEHVVHDHFWKTDLVEPWAAWVGREVMEAFRTWAVGGYPPDVPGECADLSLRLEEACRLSLKRPQVVAFFVRPLTPTGKPALAAVEVVLPSGATAIIRNTSSKPMRLTTCYFPDEVCNEPDVGHWHKYVVALVKTHCREIDGCWRFLKSYTEPVTKNGRDIEQRERFAFVSPANFGFDHKTETYDIKRIPEWVEAAALTAKLTHTIKPHPRYRPDLGEGTV